METNDVMRRVIQSIKDDLLRNTDFLSEVLANYQLKEDNIPASTIIKLMALFSKGEAAPVPQSNSPKDRSSRLARPIANFNAMIAFSEKSIGTSSVLEFIKGQILTKKVKIFLLGDDFHHAENLHEELFFNFGQMVIFDHAPSHINH